MQPIGRRTFKTIRKGSPAEDNPTLPFISSQTCPILVGLGLPDEFQFDVTSGMSGIAIEVLATRRYGVQIATVGLSPVFGGNRINDFGQECFNASKAWASGVLARGDGVGWSWVKRNTRGSWNPTSRETESVLWKAGTNHCPIQTRIPQRTNWVTAHKIRNIYIRRRRVPLSEVCSSISENFHLVYTSGIEQS